MSDKEKLLGVWVLVSNVHISVSGKKYFPYGEKPLGRLMYTAENMMSVIISKSDRKKFAKDRMFEGSPDEKISATESFLAYTGKFEIIGNEVLHHVDMSFFPNWIGTVQRRFWKLEEPNLILSTPPFVFNNEEQTAELVWKRLK